MNIKMLIKGEEINEIIFHDNADPRANIPPFI